MLAEKKMIIGETKIDFLGMHISEGQYQLQPHIATQLDHFPDANLTFKQVQQFLGIVNYMADFIHDLVKYRTPLTKQLRKDAPPWNQTCTNAVKKLKALTKNLPSLKIPSTGKRILQTDASDTFWGAVLLEEENGKRQLCGYKSGAFKSGELHYHSTYKEILALKRGIEKFQFHLIGQHFLIEMDMSAFPKMLQFKQKMLPQAQLLRWANWFSQWKFEAKHIKGKNNFLPDFLSRTRRTIAPIFPLIYSIQTEDLPPHIQDKVLLYTLQKMSYANLLAFQKIYIRRYSLSEGPLINLPLHPSFPFLTIIVMNERFIWHFPKKAYMFLWYFVEVCPFGMIFDKYKLLQYLALVDVRPRRKKHKQLYKWLALYGCSEFWRNNLRPEGNSTNGVRDQRYIFIKFECTRRLITEEDGLIIDKKYSCTFYHNEVYATNSPTE